MCTPACGFCNLIILPLQEQFYLFQEASFEIYRKCENTDTQQKCLKYSCKRSNSSWLLIIYILQEALQSYWCRQVLALRNLEYKALTLPGEPLCSGKCRIDSRWALWANSISGEISRREEVVRRNVKEKQAWPWLHRELEAEVWVVGIWIQGKTKGLIWKADIDLKLVTLTLLKSSSAFPGLGRSRYHSGSLFQWPSCLQR